MWALAAVVVLLALATVHDLIQKKHAVLRNFPIIGHLRYMLESFGPELRQYIVSDNDEERPFNRNRRRWVYATAKNENPYFGFGSDNRLDAEGYVFFRHAGFPPGAEPESDLAAVKVMGAWRDRPGAFRPSSIVNISGMSYGSLSGPAVEALNRGSALACCLHNTGEGGISRHHRGGGDLVFQIGTGYFGARGPDGRFSMDAFMDSVASAPVKAIEVKLSQGAKPGLGGVLPGAKVTPAIAAARGVPVGVTVRSPNRHPEFDDVAGLVDFVERLADASGLPVGIKSAVGVRSFWVELAWHMASTGRGPDFIAVDGGEGGTGAGPLTFTDHVALPFRAGFAEVYQTFRRGRPAPRRRVRGLGQARIRPRGHDGHGHGRRSDQRRPGGHDGRRLHPGPALPHRPLPHRGGHPEPVAGPGPGPRPTSRCGWPTTWLACGPSCHGWPRPWARLTRPWSTRAGWRSGAPTAA